MMMPRLFFNMMSRLKTIRVFGLAGLALLLGLAIDSSALKGDDWLPVPPADLALKDNPAQPGANAMILYRRSHIDARRATIDGDSVEEYYRIKIFTEKGAKDETNIQIGFTKDDSEIKDIRARTIRPDGSIVNFDGKVFDKVVEKTSEIGYSAKAFALPEVQPGCIVEYRYRRQFKPHFLHSEFWTLSGAYFTRDGSFSIAPYVPRSNFAPTLSFRTTGLPPGSLPQRQGDGSYAMEIHNVPGVVEEPLMPPLRALQARVDFFYRSNADPVGETTEQFWNRMAGKWSDALDKFLNNKSLLEADLSQTIAAGDTQEVKLRKIYARVQKIRDLSYEPAKTAVEKKEEKIKTDENVEDVLRNGYARGRQINWLFIGLVRAAGFEASTVYVVPRNRDVFKPSGQDIGALTADIVWVRAGEKEYWLDPAAVYYPFGLVPWPETEAKGVRVAKHGAEFVDTPAASSADAKLLRRADIELKTDGSADGKLEVDFTGLSGAFCRTLYRREDETGRKKAFEKYIETWLPEGSTFEVTSVANWSDTAQPLHVDGTLTVPTLGATAGHRMLVPMALFQTSYGKTFEPEKRVNQVFFSYRYEENDEVKIHGPAGFKIETIPPRKVNNPGTSMSYEISSAQQGEVVEVNRHFILSEIQFPRDSYPALRSFFNSVKSNDDAQVVFQHDESAKNN
jgi:hypothetical protein